MSYYKSCFSPLYTVIAIRKLSVLFFSFVLESFRVKRIWFMDTGEDSLSMSFRQPLSLDAHHFWRGASISHANPFSFPFSSPCLACNNNMTLSLTLEKIVRLRISSHASRSRCGRLTVYTCRNLRGKRCASIIVKIVVSLKINTQRCMRIWCAGENGSYSIHGMEEQTDNNNFVMLPVLLRYNETARHWSDNLRLITQTKASWVKLCGLARHMHNYTPV